MRDFLLRLCFVTLSTAMAMTCVWGMPNWFAVPAVVGVLMWTVREVAPRDPEPYTPGPVVTGFDPERPYHRREFLRLYYADVDPEVAVALQGIRCAELAHEVDRAAADGRRWSDEALIALEQTAGVAARDYIELRRMAHEVRREREAPA